MKEKIIAVVIVFLLYLVYENISLKKKITNLYSHNYSEKIRLLHSKHQKLRNQANVQQATNQESSYSSIKESDVQNSQSPDPSSTSQTPSKATESPKSATISSSPPQDLLDLPPMNLPPPNRNFIFHNKVPKCGGTSLKYILYVLSEDNNFTLDYQPPCIQGKAGCNKRADDGTDGEISLAKHLASKRSEKTGKFFLLKHHHWMNFTDVGMQNPTYMNVVRHPVGRFSSAYYFKRFGFAKMGADDKQGARETYKGTEEDFEQTLDECVAKKSDECFEMNQVMVSYFCGTPGKTNGDNCKLKDKENKSEWGHYNDWKKIPAATEIAKQRIIKNYYTIGILEHFNETLTLFSKMLPEYFKDVHEARYDPWAVQFASSSRTAKNPGYSDETAEILMTGPLRYEMELYSLCKKIFYERLKYFKIDIGEEVIYNKTKHTEFIPRHVHLRD